MVNYKIKDMRDIVNRTQHSITSHQKNCLILQNLYKQVKYEDFFAEFKRILYKVLLEDISVPNPFITRLLEFCAKFCTSLDTSNVNPDSTCPFLSEIFNAVLKIHTIPETKLQVCMFVNMLLKSLGEKESFLDDGICDKIRDAMVERINDVKSVVRVQATEILQRLQDPQDPNDIVINTYIKNVSDSSALVRKTIIQCIAINMTTIPVILKRCLDVDENVRLISFDKLSKIPMRVLKVEQRQYVLRIGFKDKCKKVENFLKTSLLPQWFNTYDNYFLFVLALKLDADENDFKQSTYLIEKVLAILFRTGDICKIMESLPLSADKLFSTGEINWEEMIFWRCLISFLRNSKESDYIEKIVPELTFFCNYIRRVYLTRGGCTQNWEFVQHDYIMMELIKMVSDFDFSDEAGRKVLFKLVTDLLIEAKMPYENILLLVQIYEVLIPCLNEYTNEIYNIVNEIREPLTDQLPTREMILKKDVKLAEQRVELSNAICEQEIAVERKEFGKAEELSKRMELIKKNMERINAEFEENKVQVREKKNDVRTLCACLDTLIAAMMTPRIKTMPKAFSLTLEELVEPLLVSTQPELLARALKLTGVYCSVNQELAKKSITLFCAPLLAYKYMPMYDEQTAIVAINCIADVLMVYGSTIMQSGESQLNVTKRKAANRRQLFTESQIEECNVTSVPPPSATFEDIIEVLSDLMDDNLLEVRERASEVLVKLMCIGRIHSSMLLSRLTLKWFSPATAKDVRLRQVIGQIYTIYAVEVKSSLEIIMQAFIPTLKALIQAPKTSPLADVDVDSASRFLAELMRPGRHKYNMGLDAHKDLAQLLCKEICDRPKNICTPFFLKALNFLQPPHDDHVTIDDLRKHIDIMFKLPIDKKYYKHLLKYQRRIERTLEKTATNNDNSTIQTDKENNSTMEKDNSTNSYDDTAATMVSVERKDTHRESDSTMETDVIGTANSVANSCDTTTTATTMTRYSSLSVKRKKRCRTRNSNESSVQQEPSDENSLNASDKCDGDHNSPQIVVTETDSEPAPVQKKHQTFLRRSNRKSNSKH